MKPAVALPRLQPSVLVHILTACAAKLLAPVQIL